MVKTGVVSAAPAQILRCLVVFGGVLDPCVRSIAEHRWTPPVSLRTPIYQLRVARLGLIHGLVHNFDSDVCSRSHRASLQTPSFVQLPENPWTCFVCTSQWIHDSCTIGKGSSLE